MDEEDTRKEEKLGKTACAGRATNVRSGLGLKLGRQIGQVMWSGGGDKDTQGAILDLPAHSKSIEPAYLEYPRAKSQGQSSVTRKL